MEENKMNILVIGISGAGKSTLIKAISGKEMTIGIGEGQTQQITVYESDIWPINLIDTKGFEYKFIEKIKTVKQIRDYTKKKIKENSNIGIDAVWYCIDGMTGRVFFENIKTMSTAIKGWKNIPIFAVITKSIVDENINANIEAVQNAFAKSKGMNLKGIIPIVAEEYRVGQNVVDPFGVERLCDETLDCYEEAKNISFKNRNAMRLKQKRFTAQSIIVGHTTGALVIGTSHLHSSLILVPLELSLIESIMKIYDVKVEKSVLKSFVASGAVSVIGKGTAEMAVKLVPGVNLIYGIVAAIIVIALGESTYIVSERVYNGEIDPTKINNIIDLISEALNNNPLVVSLINYLKENKDKINDKSSSQDIVKNIYDMAKKEKK